MIILLFLLVSPCENEQIEILSSLKNYKITLVRAMVCILWLEKAITCSSQFKPCWSWWTYKCILIIIQQYKISTRIGDVIFFFSLTPLIQTSQQKKYEVVSYHIQLRDISMALIRTFSPFLLCPSPGLWTSSLEMSLSQNSSLFILCPSLGHASSQWPPVHWFPEILSFFQAIPLNMLV